MEARLPRMILPHEINAWASTGTAVTLGSSGAPPQHTDNVAMLAMKTLKESQKPNFDEARRKPLNHSLGLSVQLPSSPQQAKSLHKWQTRGFSVDRSLTTICNPSRLQVWYSGPFMYVFVLSSILAVGGASFLTSFRLTSFPMPESLNQS